MASSWAPGSSGTSRGDPLGLPGGQSSGMFALVAVARPLVEPPLRVINLGLEVFARELEAAGVPVVHVDWRPPADGNPRLVALLARLEDDDED